MTKPKAATRCPSCGETALRKVRRDVETKVGKHRAVAKNIEVEECASCGERLYDMKALNDIRRAREAGKKRSVA